MARLKTCKLCNQKILPGEEFVPYKDKFSAHLTCWNVHMKALANNKQKQLEEKAEDKKLNNTRKRTKVVRDGVTEEEYKDKVKLYEYIKLLIDEAEVPINIQLIIGNYTEQYNYTFIGIYNTLKYLNEIKEKNLTGNIVGIVPYYYDEAEKYYKEIEDLEKANKDKDINSMYKERVVVIKPKERIVKQLPFD